jgi:protein disulfide-isomerase A1
LFVNGAPIEFKGGRDEDGMIEWIEQKLEQETQQIESLSQLEEAMEDNQVLVLYFGEHGTAQQNMFDILAKNYDKLKMFATDSDEIAQEFSLEENSMVLFKQFDERRNDYDGEFNVNDMMNFVNAHRFASVMRFDDDAAERIFQKEKKKTIFLFMEDNEEGAKALAGLQEAANKLKKNILFAWSDVTDDEGERLRDFLGIRAEQAPTLRLFVPDGYKKYKMEPDMEG